MFGECHAHLFMNGCDYRKAVREHKDGPREERIREAFRAYRDAGITFVREGGDHYGVSVLAKQLAPEYGIRYCSPVYAIHHNGHYGKVVGYGFDTMKEYHRLVLGVRQAGGEFIKIMISGIMDFSGDGGLTEKPLDKTEIHEMIHIAHEEGFAVMAHANGAEAVLAAVESGVDSLEHGNFMDERCLQALSASDTVWVPTYVTIVNLLHDGRFDDRVIEQLMEKQGEMIRQGYQMGVHLALGSDAGAYRVPHGQGLLDEYHQFRRLTENDPLLDERLRDGERRIRKKFCTG